MKLSTSPPLIVSLSLNPAIDLTYEVGCITHDQKSRATKTHYDPGGTGVNVGRALEKLTPHSHTCCIIAGTMGQFLRSMLNNELNNFTTLQVNGETRINTTIIQQSPQRQYEINASGPMINPEQLNQIIQQFLDLCGQGIGILTGSLPPNTPLNTYRFISEKLKQQGAKAIVDAPVLTLKETLNSHPFLIKPNLHELEALQNKPLNSLEEIATEARILTKQADYVCVSLGEQGALLASQDNSYFCNTPAIKVLSTVGAGDSLVAGLAYALSQGDDASEALKFAVACGAGTATKKGTQLFDSADINQLLEEIDIKILNI